MKQNMKQNMCILILINHIHEIQVSQSTADIAFALVRHGHQVFLGDVGSLSWGYQDEPYIEAFCSPCQSSKETWFLEMKQNISQKLCLKDCDAIMIRTNPGRDKNRGWAHDVALDLSGWAEQQGVVVLNPTTALRKASSKMFLQMFPSEIRPKSIISRNANEIVQFVKQNSLPTILKPLRGTGGSGVFIVRPDDLSNLNQIIETLQERDFVIAQEYLPEAEIGDVRLLMLQGKPLEVDGKIAMVSRLRQGHDLRSNVSKGGKPAISIFTKEIENIIQQVSPILQKEDFFLAGLDIIGSKVVEINVFSPGGIADAQHFAQVNFLDTIVTAIEQKVCDHRKY